MAFEKLVFRKKYSCALWVAALALLFAGGAIAAQPVANALSRDIDALRLVQYAFFTHKPISDTAVGLVNASADRLSIIYRTYDMTGRQLSDIKVPIPPQETSIFGPAFAVESNGTVHLFWQGAAGLHGAIIDPKGNVVSGAKVIEHVRVGEGFLPLVVEKEKCIVGFSHEVCAPIEECPPCVRFVHLSLDHKELPPTNWDVNMIFDGGYQAVADGNGDIHLIYHQFVDRTRPGEVAIYYRVFDVHGSASDPKEIARAPLRDCGQVRIACDASSKVHCYYTLRKPASPGEKKAKLEAKCVDIDNGKPCNSKRVPLRFDLDDEQLLIDSAGKQVRTAKDKADNAEPQKRRTYPMGTKR
jgi:hypothetical protein